MIFSPQVMLMALIGLLVSFGSGFVAGFKVESNRNKAALLEQERELHAAYKAKIDAQRAIAQDLAKELNDAVAASTKDAVALRAEIARARSSGKRLSVCPATEAAAPETVAAVAPYEPVARLPPAGDARLTADFVLLYDGGTAAGERGSGDSGAADAGAARAGAAEKPGVR